MASANEVSPMEEVEDCTMMEACDVEESPNSGLEDWKLEEGDKSTHKGDEVEGSAMITFNPPVYQQRYCRVREIIEALLDSPKYKSMHASVGKTVMEVGCAEFGMMRHLKNILDLGKIIFLDLDKELMEEKSHQLRPFPAEYLVKISRPEALIVEAYSGCITKVDEKLEKENPDIWAVIGIEIIEHLYPDVLRGFVETVFGIISPNVVVLTTPNSEFNEVFNLAPGKFRHWDHKFEWSRSEFDFWCKKVIEEFPCYDYKLDGICEGPEGTKHLGCVSQIATFEKKVCGHKSPTPRLPFSHRVQAGAYHLVSRIQYPNYKETRSPEEIALTEFNYHVNTFLFTNSMLDNYYELEMKELKVPFNTIQSLTHMPAMAKENQEFLKGVLERGGYQVKTEDGQMKVVFDIEQYVAANLEGSSESDINEEEYLSVDLQGLDVNQAIDCSEETWE